MKKPKLPKSVRTLEGIAALIRNEFKIPCDRTYINGWRKRHDPPFPCPGQNNEFNVRECFAWVKALQSRKGVVTSDGELLLLDRQASEAQSKKKIIAAEREQFDFDQEKGKYVFKDTAYQTVVAALTKFKFFVRDEIEKRAVVERREKLKAMGISEELAAQFYAWDSEREIALITAIEVRCEQEAKGDDAISI